MRNHITQPYGYTVFTIGSIRIYSAKIRVKADADDFMFMYSSRVDLHPVSISNNKNGCIAISWTTTDHIIHDMYRELVNTKLASIMHQRINAKYAYTNAVPETCL